MKWILRLAILALLCLFLGWMLDRDSGFVLIYFRDAPSIPWLFSGGSITIQMTFIGMFFALTSFFFLLYWGIRLLIRIFGFARNHRKTRKIKENLRAQRDFSKAMILMNEGRVLQAETMFANAALISHTPGICYLQAAKAAQLAGNLKQRDHYLSQAQYNEDLSTQSAARLLSVEYLLNDGKTEAALQELQQLKAADSGNAQWLQLATQAAVRTKSASMANTLLPLLHKTKNLNATEQLQLETDCLQVVMEDAAHQRDFKTLQHAWKSASVAAKAEQTNLIRYCGYLRDIDHADEAESVLRQALNRDWSETLIAGYGELTRGNLAQQSKQIETWVQDHPDSPYAQLSSGRIALQRGKLEEAQEYIRKSIQLMPTPEAHAVLAEILEKRGQESQALFHYKKSAHLREGRPDEVIAELLPAPEDSINVTTQHNI